MFDDLAMENDPIRGLLVIVADDEIYQHMRVEFYPEVLELEIAVGDDIRDSAW